MITVVGRTACGSAQVESDPYIPLTVTWGRASGLRPLYWRITGHQGGEVEVKADPADGAVTELVVITAPPPAEPPLVPAEVPAEEGVAVIDRTPWEVRENPDYTEFRTSVVSSVQDMGFSTASGWAYLVLSREPTASILTCENSRMHLTATGELAAVEARLPEGASL